MNMNRNSGSVGLPPSYAEERARIQASLNRNALDVSRAETFQGKYPKDAFANFALGQALFNRGEKYKAISPLEKAVQIGNSHLPYVEALARVYLDLHYPQKAITMLEEAIRIAPTSSIPLGWLGLHYSHIGRTDQAIVYFQKALALALQEFRTSLQQDLAEALLGANRKDEAQSILAELERDPTQKLFVNTRRAEIGKPNLQSPVAKNLAELIDSPEPNSSDWEKSLALLSYGRLAENSGDFDLAFESWTRSRKLVALLYDEKGTEEYFKKIIRIYTREAFEKTRTFAHSSKAAIFVVGMPRSGTTMLERILNSHAKCKGIGELGRMGQHNAYMLQHFDTPKSSDALFQDSLKGGIRDRATDFLRQAEFVAGGPAEHYIDKTPSEFLAAGCIHLCLPNAKIINMSRHPADTFISTYQHAFAEDFTYAFGQQPFAHYYLQREKLMANWRSLFGGQILDVRYEELVSDPEPQVRIILEFLGLEWDPDVLRFHESAQMVRTFSRDQVRNQINTKSVDRWRNYEKHLGPLFEAFDKAGYSYPATKTETPRLA